LYLFTVDICEILKAKYNNAVTKFSDKLSEISLGALILDQFLEILVF